MSQTGVSKLLRRVEARALGRVDDLAKTTKVRQLMRTEALYREAFDAWLKSKNGTTKKIRRTVEGRDGQQQVAEVQTGESPGDPRFLEQARAALAVQRELLGLNKATEIQHVHVDRPLEHLTDAELNAKIAELALTQQKKAGGGDQPH
jgi:hypothetical protein